MLKLMVRANGYNHLCTCGEIGSTHYLEVVAPKGMEVRILSGAPASVMQMDRHVRFRF